MYRGPHGNPHPVDTTPRRDDSTGGAIVWMVVSIIILISLAIFVAVLITQADRLPYPRRELPPQSTPRALGALDLSHGRVALMQALP